MATAPDGSAFSIVLKTPVPVYDAGVVTDFTNEITGVSDYSLSEDRTYMTFTVNGAEGMIMMVNVNFVTVYAV